MTMQTDDYWIRQGRDGGGNRPDSSTSDREREQYYRGKEMREFDRGVDEALERMRNDGSKS